MSTLSLTNDSLVPQFIFEGKSSGAYVLSNAAQTVAIDINNKIISGAWNTASPLLIGGPIGSGVTSKKLTVTVTKGSLDGITINSTDGMVQGGFLIGGNNDYAFGSTKGNIVAFSSSGLVDALLAPNGGWVFGMNDYEADLGSAGSVKFKNVAGFGRSVLPTKVSIEASLAQGTTNLLTITNNASGTSYFDQNANLTVPSISTRVNRVSGNYTFNVSDHSVIFSGAYTGTLPSASTVTGKIFIAKNLSASTNVTLYHPAGTIDNISPYFTLSSGNRAVQLQSDGSNYLVIGAY